MKNQTPVQTEPGREMTALGICEVGETGLGSVRLALPVEPEPQSAWPGGRETGPKLIWDLLGTQIQSNAAMQGTNSLVEWCRQLPAPQLRNELALGFPDGKDNWQAKNKQRRK